LKVTEQHSGGVSADKACNNLERAKITWLIEMGRCPLEWVFHWTSPRRGLLGWFLFVEIREPNQRRGDALLSMRVNALPKW